MLKNLVAEIEKASEIAHESYDLEILKAECLASIGRIEVHGTI